MSKFTAYLDLKRNYDESYRHEKMDDLVDDIFGGDYEKAYEALVLQMSDAEFKEAEEYIRRMHK